MEIIQFLLLLLLLPCTYQAAAVILALGLSVWMLLPVRPVGKRAQVCRVPSIPRFGCHGPVWLRYGRAAA